ncbi:MAG: L-serine ammonia-lyase [Candidatus Cloacimonetes bacterium 4572_65]|nr:MAG: L-serine ammonia-lyase [Candidatus Cloacimonetes bacterium 4572_65]
MESIRTLFKIGYGPSSSHTMGPSNAALSFKEKHSRECSFIVTLYGSLALTGKGHLTDKGIETAISPQKVEFIWRPETFLPFHPNGMKLEAVDTEGNIFAEEIVYSVGGGALAYEGEVVDTEERYPYTQMEDIIRYCQDSGKTFWEYVFENEDKDFFEYLTIVWRVMKESVERGIKAQGALPGGLGVSRKAYSYNRKVSLMGHHYKQSGLLYAYALAVAEENASAGKVVTSPTCGSSGVLPSVLYFMCEDLKLREEEIVKALATAGLFGSLVRHNASISGAEVGCQGEIGTACSIAAAAANQLMGGSIRQIEYAAEIGLEHNLGLTCDPVCGLVQIPCIERNAFAARSAMSACDYSLFSDGTHFIKFDEVVRVMKKTGHDIPSLYKETSIGGLALEYSKRLLNKKKN